jgi:GNAT superfamily N-acetyltransferase
LSNSHVKDHSKLLAHLIVSQIVAIGLSAILTVLMYFQLPRFSNDLHWTDFVRYHSSLGTLAQAAFALYLAALFLYCVAVAAGVAMRTGQQGFQRMAREPSTKSQFQSALEVSQGPPFSPSIGNQANQSLQIQAAKESDLPTVSQMFQEGLGDDSELYEVERANLLLLAQVNEETVGAGAIFRSKIHGHLPKAVIVVRPQNRRHQIGTNLHRALLAKAVSPTDLGVDGACHEKNKDALSFMKALGYQAYLECRILTWDLAQCQEHLTVGDLQVLSQEVDSEEKYNRIQDFLVRRYSETHDWNPVTMSKENRAWSEIVFAGVDFDLSSVILKGNEILGVSTAAPKNSEELEILWAFSEKADLVTEAERLKELLSTQLRLAFQKGYKRSTIEMDSSDQGLSKLKDWLPVTDQFVWKRFRHRI